MSQAFPVQVSFLGGTGKDLVNFGDCRVIVGSSRVVSSVGILLGHRNYFFSRTLEISHSSWLKIFSQS